LRRKAAHATWDCNAAETDCDHAEMQVCLAQEAGDTALEQRWQKRVMQLRDRADRAYDLMTSAEEAVAEEEWAIENPEEAAAERAAAPERRKQGNELFGKLLRDGVIPQELYERLIGSAARG